MSTSTMAADEFQQSQTPTVDGKSRQGQSSMTSDRNSSSEHLETNKRASQSKRDEENVICNSVNSMQSSRKQSKVQLIRMYRRYIFTAYWRRKKLLQISHRDCTLLLAQKPYRRV